MPAISELEFLLDQSNNEKGVFQVIVEGENSGFLINVTKSSERRDEINLPQIKAYTY